MPKLYLKILLVCAISANFTLAQDATISASISPANGCNLTASEIVGVVVLNNSTLFIPANSITVNYSINGGATVSQLLGTNLASGATWNFNFSTTADLSACNTDFNIKTWITYAADIDNSNDTLIWLVRNDCTVIPGDVLTDETVCYGANGNTLNLTGWSYGSISNWLYSEDGGTTWNAIANTTTSETFSNLILDRLYKVAIDGGYCPNDTSATASITVQPLPIGGTLSGPDSLCINSASGVINLAGNSAAVVDWQTSINNGATWTGIGNASSIENFSGLTQTTLYRVEVVGGVCPNTYSDTLEVYIEQLSVAGTLDPDTLICENNALTLTLGASTGSIVDWGSSPDGTTWSPLGVPSPTNTYNTGNLTDSTYFHVEIKNGICPSVFSDSILVQVQTNVTSGTVSGGTSTCASNATGVLNINGNSSGVLNWETSTDNGTTWSNIANTTTTENYTGLSQTTWYRALIDGGVCMDRFTDTAYITVSAVTVAGILNANTTICAGNNYTMNLTGNTGTVVRWQSSTDGISWTNIGVTDSTYTASSITDSIYYRTIVKSGICAEDTSNIIFIDVFPLPIANAGNDTTILLGDTAQLVGNGGLLCAWTPGGSLNDSTLYNPLAFPPINTTYTLAVIDANGCFGFDDVTVSVGSPIPPLDVKNVITPNKDGYNDTWYIEGYKAYPNIAVRVYNIYGQEVYKNDDYKNDWSGNYKGKSLPNGTYIYIVMPGGTEDMVKGNLTILGDE